MDDLEVDFSTVLPWFPHEQEEPYVLIRVSAEHAQAWARVLGVPLRRCYITDAALQARAAALGISRRQVLATKLPDPGSTMAGDFGEILGYFYQAARELPTEAVGAKRWRLKQDRTKPAPGSDVVHLVLPAWPNASAQDAVLCSEVKLKSTDGKSTPIADAIQDCEKDRTSRLARTLVWLRERAHGEDLGDISIAQLERFINATDFPAATRRFRAVAVVCETLAEKELVAAPAQQSAHYQVVVVVVPTLRETYMAVFNAAQQSVDE